MRTRWQESAGRAGRLSDLDAAVTTAIEGAFCNAGQNCTATSRVILQRGIKDAFTTKFVARAAALSVGDPSEPANFVGPVVDENQYEKIVGYIRAGVTEGRRCCAAATPGRTTPAISSSDGVRRCHARHDGGPR